MEAAVAAEVQRLQQDGAADLGTGSDFDKGSDDDIGGEGLLPEQANSGSDDDFGGANILGEADDDSGAEADREDEAEAGPSGTGFTRAFAKIMEREALTDSKVAPILAGSKSLAKRKAEEEDAERVDREAKRLRIEMKRRGHVAVPKKGENPQHDVREKGLVKLATRGVVRLFNAVAKAQKQQREAEAGGSKSKVPKLSKASFLAELKGGAPSQQMPIGGPAAAAGKSKKAAEQTAPHHTDEQPAGWDVLREGFTGLQGGQKMKDWDKQESSDDDQREDLDQLSDSELSEPGLEEDDDDSD
ncbi:hypothetical protein WJX72_005147 [[Myrmecia] bisecta]|uniref:RRP15-like protein n=1 Tax=[Myrmecia] bisecta TaxID=41462 RepID=A0AAW1PFF6_9CHLO